MVNGEEFTDVLPCRPGVGEFDIPNANGELTRYEGEETSGITRDDSNAC